MWRKVLVGLVAFPIVGSGVGLYYERAYPRISGRDSLSDGEERAKSHGGGFPDSAWVDQPHLRGYPNSYYRSVCKEKIFDREKLTQVLEADVCVVGAGLSGLSTALSLAEQGKRVIVLESKRIGWNASGRNGGFALAGFGVEPEPMAEDMGDFLARKYYLQTLDALELVKQRIETYKIDCEAQYNGFVELSFLSSPPHPDDITCLNLRLGTEYQLWDKEKAQQLYKNEKVRWALYDPNAFIVNNPLALVVGLARAAESHGVKIFEDSPALGVETFKQGYEVRGQQGSVVCSHVVLAGANHIHRAIDVSLAQSTVPLYTYIGVTEPLGDKLDLAISPEASYSVVDDFAVLNYFRPLPDKRLLWGGFAQTFERDNDNLDSNIKELILSTFPQLGDDLRLEYIWGGDIAYSHHQYPLVGRLANGMWYASGFGGHGLIPTTWAGSLISKAILTGDQSEVDDYQNSFPLGFTGGVMDRLCVQMVFSLHQLYDTVRMNYLSLFARRD